MSEMNENIVQIKYICKYAKLIIYYIISIEYLKQMLDYNIIKMSDYSCENLRNCKRK